MKKIGTILLSVCFAAFIFSFQPASAQDKTKQDKEREMKLQEEIDAQKKAISEQKKAQEEAINNWQSQQKNVEEAMKQAKIQLDSTRHMQRYFRNFNSDMSIPGLPGEPFFFDKSIEPYLGHPFGGGAERTTWDFSKSIKENSYSGDYTFDVEPTASTVVMSVNGDCKKGEIRIKIVMPNGKTYSDILIDEFGNLDWRKSFNISDSENKDKAGAWKFQISAKKATGYFKISLQTF
jgi:hypothetical protein